MRGREMTKDAPHGVRLRRTLYQSNLGKKSLSSRRTTLRSGEGRDSRHSEGSQTVCSHPGILCADAVLEWSAFA
jgi:hypothetical protein